MLVGGVSLLVAAAKLVFVFSTTTEQRFRSLCAAQLQDSDGTIRAVNVPCNPHTVDVATSWRAPVLMVTLGLLGAIVVATYILVPQFTRAAPELNPMSVAPLQGVQGRKGLNLRLQPVFTWVYRTIGAGFVVGAIALSFAGTPLAVLIGFFVFGALFLRMSGVASIHASPDGLRVRMLLFRRTWVWHDITRLFATDGVSRRGYRVRYFVVETSTAEPFYRESLSSSPGGKNVSRADRALAAIEGYRASIGHLPLQRDAR